MKVAVIYHKKETAGEDVINLFGPQSKEHYNIKTVNRVATALEKGGHNVRTVEGNMQVADHLRDFMPKVMSGEKPGMVFNMAYGIQGHSRYTHVPAMLEMLGVPYVGSGPQAHAVALDKVVTKIILRQAGLPTPDFWVFHSAEEVTDDVVWPVIVKPKMEAVSMGLKIVDNTPDLREAVKFIVDTYQQEALCEAFIPGREFAVGLLGNGNDIEVLPIVEIDLGGNPDAIQTQDDKTKKPHQKLCPAPVTGEQAEELRRLARGAFRALGCCDFARVDLRLDEQGNFHILELNSMASLGATGSYIHAAKTAGYSDESMINRMLEVAAVRYFGSALPEGEQPSNDEETAPLRTRIRTYLRSQTETIRDTVETLVETTSGAYHPEDVNQLASWLSSRLGQLGFQRQVFPRSDVGNPVYLTNHEADENSVLILAYLDTHPENVFHVPFREERGRWYGTSIAESRGGLAVLLAALQSLRFTRRIKKTRCGVLLVPDHSLGCPHSRDLIDELSGRSRHVVGLLGGLKDGGIITSSSGQIMVTLDFTDTRRLRGDRGQEVITHLCRKVTALQKLTDPEAGIEVVPRSILSHAFDGRTPEQAKAVFSIHCRDRAGFPPLLERIRQTARKGIDTKLQPRIREGVLQPPVPESAENQAFYEKMAATASRLEIKTNPVHGEGASGVCHARQTVPVLDGLGPIGGGVRSPHEYILRDSLIDRAALLALTIYNRSREGAG